MRRYRHSYSPSFAERYSPSPEEEQGLTVEQRASIDEGADRALRRDASVEGSTAYWLFRTGPEKMRQISRAMNDGDDVLAKQLHDEVDEFFRTNRAQIERDFVGYRAAGPTAKAIYSFAEAGLDGTLWSNTMSGPRAVMPQGGSDDQGVPATQSYNDFMYDRSPQRMESQARRYRKEFNIKSDPVGRGTADYVLANPDDPMHGLYSGLVERYNGYLAESQNRRVSGEARDKATGNASRVKSFIGMLDPVRREFQEGFGGDAVRETAFWDNYYRNFADRADRTHMTKMVKAYTEHRDAEGNMVNPEVWMRQWTDATNTVLGDGVVQVPVIGKDGSAVRDSDGNLKTTGMRRPVTASDRAKADRYMAAIPDSFAQAGLRYDPSNPDHVTVASTTFKDYQLLKDAGIDLFDSTEYGIAHPSKALGDYLAVNLRGDLPQPDANNDAYKIKFLKDTNALLEQSLTPKSTPAAEDLKYGDTDARADEPFALHEKSFRREVFREIARVSKELPRMADNAGNLIGLLQSAPAVFDRIADAVVRKGALDGLGISREAAGELARTLLGNLTLTDPGKKPLSMREAMVGTMDLGGQVKPRTTVTSAVPVATFTGVHGGVPQSVNGASAKALSELSVALTNKPESLAPEMLRGDQNPALRTKLKEYGKALTRQTLGDVNAGRDMAVDLAEEAIALQLIASRVPPVFGDMTGLTKFVPRQGDQSLYDSMGLPVTPGSTTKAGHQVFNTVVENALSAESPRVQASTLMLAIDRMVNAPEDGSQHEFETKEFQYLADSLGLPQLQVKSDQWYDVGVRDTWSEYISRYRDNALATFRQKFGKDFTDPLEDAGLADGNGKFVRGQVLHAMQRMNLKEAKRVEDENADARVKAAFERGDTPSVRDELLAAATRLAPRGLAASELQGAVADVSAWIRSQPMSEEEQKALSGSAAAKLRDAYRIGGLAALHSAKRSFTRSRLVYHPNTRPVKDRAPGEPAYSRSFVTPDQMERARGILGAADDGDFAYKNWMYYGLFNRELANRSYHEREITKAQVKEEYSD